MNTYIPITNRFPFRKTAQTNNILAQNRNSKRPIIMKLKIYTEIKNSIRLYFVGKYKN